MLRILLVIFVCQTPFVARKDLSGFQYAENLGEDLGAVRGMASSFNGVDAIKVLVGERQLHEIPLHALTLPFQPVLRVELVAPEDLVVVDGDALDLGPGEPRDVAHGAPDAAAAVQQLGAAGDAVLDGVESTEEDGERCNAIDAYPVAGMREEGKEGEEERDIKPLNRTTSGARSSTRECDKRGGKAREKVARIEKGRNVPSGWQGSTRVCGLTAGSSRLCTGWRNGRTGPSPTRRKGWPSLSLHVEVRVLKRKFKENHKKKSMAYHSKR